MGRLEKIVAGYLLMVTTIGVFSCALPVPVAAQNRESRKSSANDAVDKVRNERLTRARNVIDNVFSDSKSLANPVLRIKLRMLVASGYWEFKQERAREIFTDEFPRIEQITLPQ